MQTFRLNKRANEITERDIERMFPAYIGDGYRDLNITWVSNPESEETYHVRLLVQRVVRSRGISATVMSTQYIYTGEPELIVELGDVSNEGR